MNPSLHLLLLLISNACCTKLTNGLSVSIIPLGGRKSGTRHHQKSCETERRDRQDVKVQLVFVIPELKYLGISGIFAKSVNGMSLSNAAVTGRF